MAAQLLGDLFLNGITGAPSGSVRFYQPQTLVPITVWSNDGATQAITQPVQLDGSGKSVVPVYLTVPARMIVYSSSGAQLMDVERVDGTRAETAALANTLWPAETSVNAALTALATSLGGTDGNFRASGTGSIARSVQAKLSDMLSLKDFGAKGDGVTDDTAAIVSAVAAANALGGSIIYVPAGTYLSTTTTAISGNGISLKGSGSLTSIIKFSGASTDCLSVAGSRCVFEDLGISHSTTSTGAAINVTSTTGFVTISRVRTTGHRTGIAFSGAGAVRNLARDCEVICDGNAAALGVNIAAGSRHSATQCHIDTGAAAGTAVFVQNGVSGTVLFGNYIAQASVGFSMNDSTNTVLIGNTANSVTTFYSLTSFATAAVILGNIDSGFTITDTSVGTAEQVSSPGSGRWSSGYVGTSTNVAITSAYGVTNTSYNQHHVKGTAAGITITISNPSQNPPTPGATISFFLENASGGAVTWAFGANYRVAAVAPANGTGIGLVVSYNAALAKWVEVSRGTAA